MEVQLTTYDTNNVTFLNETTLRNVRPLLGQPNAERHDAKFSAFQGHLCVFTGSITEVSEFGRQ